MDYKPFGGFLKGLFGRQISSPPAQATSPPIQETKAPARPAHAIPATEAYLNRKKGRKPLSEGWPILKALLETIQNTGEAVPGDLAKAFSMPRSTLAYNLKFLVSKGCVERLGGGRSIRYRATGKELK